MHVGILWTVKCSNISLKSFGTFPIFSIFKNLQKVLVVKRNGEKIGLGVRYLVYTGYFLLLSVQGQAGVIRCISYFSDFQEPCISKTAGRRVKWTKKCLGIKY